MNCYNAKCDRYANYGSGNCRILQKKYLNYCGSYKSGKPKKPEPVKPEKNCDNRRPPQTNDKIKSCDLCIADECDECDYDKCQFKFLADKPKRKNLMQMIRTNSLYLNTSQSEILYEMSRQIQELQKQNECTRP